MFQTEISESPCPDGSPRWKDVQLSSLIRDDKRMIRLRREVAFHNGRDGGVRQDSDEEWRRLTDPDRWLSPSSCRIQNVLHSTDGLRKAPRQGCKFGIQRHHSPVPGGLIRCSLGDIKSERSYYFHKQRAKRPTEVVSRADQDASCELNGRTEVACAISTMLMNAMP